MSYNNNVAIGTATITISPNQNYFNGYKSVEFELVDSGALEPDPIIGGTLKGSAGAWWYQYSDGSFLKSCWKDIDGARYYFDDNGYAKAGWALIDVLVLVRPVDQCDEDRLGEHQRHMVLVFQFRHDGRRLATDCWTMVLFCRIGHHVDWVATGW